MTERDQLEAKWKEAIERKQYDIAAEYFQATIEAGAKELDAMKPGLGDVWRGISRAVAALTSAQREDLK